MNDSPFISIITVCYNSGQFIEQTITSVLKQGFSDYEYIIVDGKSKDNTLDIIRSFEHKFDGRMHWISEPDSGIYDAMNKGIRLAKGRLVWLVNSDDYIQKDALQSIYDTYQNYDKTDYPIISFAYNQIDLSGLFKQKVFFDEEKCNWCAKRDYMGVLHPATIVPAKVYLKYGLYDTWYKVIADLDWFRRLIKGDARIEFEDIVITNMRDGGASATHYYKDRIKEYKHYCFKNYCFFEALLRFARLWLQRIYGHVILKWNLKKIY